MCEAGERHQSAAGAAPVLDNDVLVRIGCAVGDRGLASLLSLFVDDAMRRPAIIRALAEIGQCHLADFECAALRGACQMIGARRLATACLVVEDTLTCGCVRGTAIGAGLSTIADETIAAIDAWRADDGQRHDHDPDCR